MNRQNLFHLVDFSKHVHNIKHHLKKHISYAKHGEDLRHENIMEHVGHHQMPHGKHKISIHHHEGHHDYYPQEFDSHDDADKHVKDNFRFIDAFPGHAKKYVKENYPEVADVANKLKPIAKEHLPQTVEKINKIQGQVKEQLEKHVEPIIPHVKEAAKIANKLKPIAKEHLPNTVEKINKISGQVKEQVEKHVKPIIPHVKEAAGVIGEGIEAYKQSKLPEYIEHKVAPYAIKVGELLNYPELGKFAGAALSFGSKALDYFKGNKEDEKVLDKQFTEE